MQNELVALYERFVEFNAQANHSLGDGFDSTMCEAEFVRRFQEMSPCDADRLRQLLTAGFAVTNRQSVDDALAEISAND